MRALAGGGDDVFILRILPEATYARMMLRLEHQRTSTGSGTGLQANAHSLRNLPPGAHAMAFCNDRRRTGRA